MLKKKKHLVQRYSGDKGRLLDIGSGTGYFLKTMKDAGWSISGVEVDDTARSLCLSKFDIEAVPSLKDASVGEHEYDAITMWHVMEHVHDLNGYWETFKNKLSSNGTLIIAVPNPESLDAEYYGSAWAAWDVPRHLWHFRSQDMERLASKHGFHLVTKNPMPLDAYYVSILSEKYQGSNALTSLLSGLFRGWISNLKSRRVEDRSSIIYIFKQKSA
jgi:SAM-dependent methyltransferase